MGRKIILNLTTQYILSRISEEEIFEKYVCPVEYGTLFRNPLRNDKKPTANFYVNQKGKVILHDFNGFFHGDCFAAVQKACGGIGFREALIKISNDFGLLKSNNNSRPIIYNEEKKPKAPAKIQIKIQDWTESDIEYWKSFYLTSGILDKYNVHSISKLWINGEVKYTYKKNDPAYAYYFGNGFYKIYFPMRKENRFITNTNNFIIQGYDQLPESYDFLIITKSLKDVMVLDLFNIPAIAPQAEGNNIPEDIIEMLKERFPIILINYDFDYAGIKAANKARKKFDVLPIFMTNGRFNTIDFGSKDPAEYINKNGPDKTKELILDSYNNYII